MSGVVGSGGHWDLLFAYVEQPLIALLFPIAIGTGLFTFAGWQSIVARRGTAPGPYGHDTERRAQALLASLAGLFVIGMTVVGRMDDKAVATAVRQGTCTPVVGVISDVQPEGGAGQRGFTIGGQYIPYDNHARGFNQQRSVGTCRCAKAILRECAWRGTRSDASRSCADPRETPSRGVTIERPLHSR